MSFLIAIVSPAGSVTVQPTDITIPYYGDALFNCSGQGGPNNLYSWIHLSSGESVSNESELIIEIATLKDAGVYQCTVSNNAGKENTTANLNGMPNEVVISAFGYVTVGDPGDYKTIH